jgi:hypothetical protein
VLQRLLENISDFALRTGNTDVETLLVDLPGRPLGSDQSCSHLRPVSMGNNESHAILQQSHNSLRNAVGIGDLFWDRTALAGTYQGIATYGNKSLS